ncbi:MAG: ribonuclease H [Bacteriovoracaceae bacterium]
MNHDIEKVLTSFNLIKSFYKEQQDEELMKLIDKLYDKTSAKYTEKSSKREVQVNGKKKIANENEKSNFVLPVELRVDTESYALFCDGACRGNPGPGAYGIVAQNQKGEILFEASGIDYKTTNNKMELLGAIICLENLSNLFLENELNQSFVSAMIYLYTDSRYVVDGMNSWVSSWKKRGWKKADNTPPENLELWQKLDELAKKFKLLQFIWVKGHNGHPQNEYCDYLANIALNENGF